MLFKEPLNVILGQLSKVKIMRFLVRTRVESSGREIARSSGISHVKCHSALQELSRYGFVRMHRSGKSLLYNLEEQNIIVKDILIPLFEKESRLFNMLAKKILKGISSSKPISIIVFGSTARGDSEALSDIDVLIIFPDKKDMKSAKKEIEDLATNISLAFGSRLSPILFDAERVKKKFKRGEALFRQIASDGRIIYGKSIPEL